MSTDPVQAASASSDPARLRRDIEEVRGELAETVDALAAKADVRARARDQAQELKVQATDKARGLTAQAIEKAPRVWAQAAAKSPQLTRVAQQKTQRAQRVVQDKAAAALGVPGLLLRRVGVGGRRIRRFSRPVGRPGQAGCGGERRWACSGC